MNRGQKTLWRLYIVNIKIQRNQCPEKGRFQTVCQHNLTLLAAMKFRQTCTEIVVDVKARFVQKMQNVYRLQLAFALSPSTFSGKSHATNQIIFIDRQVKEYIGIRWYFSNGAQLE